MRSSFPHGWENLKSAYYNEYKYNILSQEESIFAYRSDYLVPIATLNLKDPSKIFGGLKEKISSPILKEKLANIDFNDVGLEKWHSFIMQNHNAKDPLIREDARMMGAQIYKEILYPPKDNTNL